MNTVPEFRRVDDVGRVVIPGNIRRKLDIQPGAPLRISVKGENIFLSKCNPLQNIAALSQQQVSVFYKKFAAPIAICDEDSIFLCQGCVRCCNTNIPKQCGTLILQQKIYISPGDGPEIELKDQFFSISAVFPVTDREGSRGAVLLLEDSKHRKTIPAGALACAEYIADCLSDVLSEQKI